MPRTVIVIVLPSGSLSPKYLRAVAWVRTTLAGSASARAKSPSITGSRNILAKSGSTKARSSLRPTPSLVTVTGLSDTRVPTRPGRSREAAVHSAIGVLLSSGRSEPLASIR